jgi:hypothetical protein
MRLKRILATAALALGTSFITFELTAIGIGTAAPGFGLADAGWFHRTGTVSGSSRIITLTAGEHTTTIAATGADALN